MNAAHTNRLSKETSPYLLQHQHNPVDWYAWGEEAFEAARAYCRRILGMAAGRIVFDGPPEALTEQTLLAIYGEAEGTLDERITSVSLPSVAPPMLARL